jgi:hypothetical protein
MSINPTGMLVFRIDICSLDLNFHFITIETVSIMSVLETIAIVKVKMPFAPNGKMNFAAPYWFQHRGTSRWFWHTQ